MGNTHTLSSMKKDDLIALAEKHGLPQHGTRAHLIERLQAMFDDAKETLEKTEATADSIEDTIEEVIDIAEKIAHGRFPRIDRALHALQDNAILRRGLTLGIALVLVGIGYYTTL